MRKLAVKIATQSATKLNPRKPVCTQSSRIPRRVGAVLRLRCSNSSNGVENSPTKPTSYSAIFFNMISYFVPTSDFALRASEVNPDLHSLAEHESENKRKPAKCDHKSHRGDNAHSTLNPNSCRIKSLTPSGPVKWSHTVPFCRSQWISNPKNGQHSRSSSIHWTNPSVSICLVSNWKAKPSGSSRLWSIAWRSASASRP
jgi:hypothetical protein